MKVVATVEYDVLMNQPGVMTQVSAQLRCFAGVEEVHRAARDGVPDALMMRHSYAVRRRGLFDVGLEARPRRESIFARYGELRVAELQRRCEDLSIAGVSEAGMKFAQPLRSVSLMCTMGREQVFGLVLEMNKAGLRRKISGRHTNSLS